jgi:hypothetical protein
MHSSELSVLYGFVALGVELLVIEKKAIGFLRWVGRRYDKANVLPSNTPAPAARSTRVCFAPAL